MAKLTFDLSSQPPSLPRPLLRNEPTHVSRYWLMARLLAGFTTVKDLKILDVGGKESLLPAFGNFKPTVLDTDPSDQLDFVLGNALQMPFGNAEFDAVISCDVLEHIKEKDRGQFILEALRVSRELVIICAPFDNPGVAAAERDVNDYHKSLLGGGHRWLQEHIENGLPSEKATEATIKEMGFNYTKFRHFSLDIWSKILKLHLLNAAYGDSEDVTEETAMVYANYYNDLCSFDFSESGYRTFFVISKKQLMLRLPSSGKVLQKKQEFDQHLLDSMISTLENQAAGMRISKQAAGALQHEYNLTVQRLKQAETELHAIKSSKTWRVLRKAARLKRAVRLRS